MRRLAFVFVFFISTFCAALQPAGVMAAEDDIFIPGSAWLVGAASLIPTSDEGETGLPCIMMNQYNNGFIVRVSGGGGRVMAMAVDFRQDAFKMNKDYNINLRIPETSFDAHIPARAYSRQSLLFGTQEAVGLYDALKNARTMEITVGNKTFKFAMIGARDGIDRMEACYSGTPVYDSKPATVNAKSDLPSAPASALPSSRHLKTMNGATEEPAVRYSHKEPGSQNAEADEEEAVLTPLPMDGEMERVAVPEPDADIGKALQQATDKAHSVEPAAGTYNVTENREGTAVPAEEKGQMMARSWQSPLIPEEKTEPKALKRQRDIMFPSSAAGSENAAAVNPVDVSEQAVKRWRAIRGSNLREVLDNWSQSANVRLLWMAERDFPVQESLIVQGSFEEAVRGVLEQYAGSKSPFGRIYNDPAAGQRVLLIESR